MAMLHREELPFTVELKSFWKHNPSVIDKARLEYFTDTKQELNQLKEKKIVSIPEYKKFSLNFQVDIPEVEAKLELKGGGRAQKITLLTGEEKFLFDPDDEIIERPWPPDCYLVVIEFNNRKYYSYLQIDAKNMSQQELNQLRRMVNRLTQGLIFDTRYEKETVTSEYNSYQNQYSILNILLEDKEKLLQNYRSILNSPIEEIKKKYQKRNDKFKLDNKGARWLASSKGQALNKNQKKPNILYQKKAYNSLSNSANKWMIKIVNYLRTELLSLQADLEEKLVQISSSQSINVKSKLRKTKELFNSFDFIINSQLYQANQDFNKVKQVPRLVFKDPRYLRIYNIYQQIITNKQTENKYQFKQSDKLYEYYILFNTINALSDLGFVWADKLAHEEARHRMFNNRVPEDHTFTLQQDDYKIEVSYEAEIPCYSERDIRIGSQEFFTLWYGYQPDIRVDLYDNNRLKQSFIIEVKYRRFDRLYRPDHNTEVINQIAKYRNNTEYIRYNGDLIRPIDKVIVTYPKDSYRIVNKEHNNRFIFIQLSPQEEGRGHYGYQEFRDYLAQILKI
ncbi:hypothetical protein JCM16358_03010 [Halanaerocella petrolearia]